MSEYNFERFNILVAEDNWYLRSLLVQSLRALGVGQVHTADGGEEAIELLALAQRNPVKAGFSDVDIIYANWEMRPVDGLDILKWVRRNGDSLNPFVPFILVTAYPDREKVDLARDHGVSELLVKPFSVATIAERLLKVVERPRQFVHTPTYFGPDRRRRSSEAHDGDERRIIKESQIEIVYDYDQVA